MGHLGWQSTESELFHIHFGADVVDVNSDKIADLVMVQHDAVRDFVFIHALLVRQIDVNRNSFRIIIVLHSLNYSREKHYGS